MLQKRNKGFIMPDNKNLPLPYNIEAERAVLGALIRGANETDNIITALTVDDFYDAKNKTVYKAIYDLVNQGIDIDVTAITNYLDVQMKSLDLVGGVNYLRNLAEEYMGEVNTRFYVKIIQDDSLSRRLILTMDDCINGFSKKISDVSGYIAECENNILKVTQRRRVAEFVDTSTIAQQISRKLKTDQKKVAKINPYCTGITTGYNCLDKVTTGWQPGSLIIIGARPSVGKTALSVNFIYNAASLMNRPIAFFSLEMDAASIGIRMLSMSAQINSRNIYTNELSPDDWAALDVGLNNLEKLKIYIDDTPSQKLNDIRTKCKKLKATNPDLGAIFIDYLGLITTNAKLGEISRTQEIANITASLKALARELEVPVICLAQLSRSNEKENRMPVLSDLRDSGSIEQDADQVIFIHRPDYQKQGKQSADKTMEEGKKNPFEANPDDDSPNGNAVETSIIVAKNRNGQTRTVNLIFMKNIGKFVELDTHENQ
jgi:replicative DNA helicase